MRRSPLRSKGRTDHSSEPGYHAYKEWVWGECAICAKRCLTLRHHVVKEQHVRAISGADPWDLRNAILIGAGFDCDCHRDHHSVVNRIALAKVPLAAVEFAIELYGAPAAQEYLHRHYAPPSGT